MRHQRCAIGRVPCSCTCYILHNTTWSGSQDGGGRWSRRSALAAASSLDAITRRTRAALTMRSMARPRTVPSTRCTSSRAAQFQRQDHSSRRHRHEDWYARPDAAAADGAAGPARHRCKECVRGIARARHAQCDGCCLRYLSSRRLRHEEWYLRRACRRDRDDHGWQLGHLRNLLMHPARPPPPSAAPTTPCPEHADPSLLPLGPHTRSLLTCAPDVSRSADQRVWLAVKGGHRGGADQQADAGLGSGGREGAGRPQAPVLLLLPAFVSVPTVPA